MKLTVLRPRLAVCRLAPDAALPGWARGTGLWSVTRTADELSVICDEQRVPEDVQSEDGWRAIRLEGPFELSEVGVLLPVVATLADAGVSLLPLGTYDTDYVLVKEQRLEHATQQLEAAGHCVEAG